MQKRNKSNETTAAALLKLCITIIRKSLLCFLFGDLKCVQADKTFAKMKLDKPKIMFIKRCPLDEMNNT